MIGKMTEIKCVGCNESMPKSIDPFCNICHSINPFLILYNVCHTKRDKNYDCHKDFR